jgi:hypothetical protein
MKSYKNTIFAVLLFILIPICISNGAKASTWFTKTKVSVHPEEIKVKVGEVFEVYINISDVSGLQGFDFMLKYDTDVLDCLALEEGTFLKSFGDTFVAKKEVNDEFTTECGRVWLAVVILGEGYANGSGTLAVMRFNATAVGESVLDLYSDYPYKPDEVKLTTCGSQAIQNVAVDGHVVVDPCSSNPGPPDPPDPPDDPVDPPSPDVNKDGFVDIRDLAMIARAYGSSAGNERYDAKVDLDENGLIDIRDVSICARMFGKAV